MVDRIIVSLTSAGTLMGMAVVTLAQAVTDTDATAIERYIAGGVLIAAAGLIVRWTFKLIAEVRSVADADRVAFTERTRQDHAAALEREQMLLSQLKSQGDQVAVLYAQLASERALRLSLEKAGVQDRRSTPDG